MLVQSVIKILVAVAGMGIVLYGLFADFKDDGIKGEITIKNIRIKSFGRRLLVVLVGLALVCFVVMKGSEKIVKDDGTVITRTAPEE